MPIPKLASQYRQSGSITFGARHASILLTVSLFALGVALLNGCSPPERDSAKRPSEEVEYNEPPEPYDTLSADKVGQSVSVEGKVLQQCPSSGCWLIMETNNKPMFVDLSRSSTRLSNSRVGERVRVEGEVKPRGSQLAIEASRIEFEDSLESESERSD